MITRSVAFVDAVREALDVEGITDATRVEFSVDEWDDGWFYANQALVFHGRSGLVCNSVDFSDTPVEALLGHLSAEAGALGDGQLLRVTLATNTIEHTRRNQGRGRHLRPAAIVEYVTSGDGRRQPATLFDDLVARYAANAHGDVDTDMMLARGPGYLLIEQVEGDGGYWLTSHSRPADAADYHDGLNRTGEWRIITLVDVTTGEQFNPVRTTTWQPAGIAA